ncbi:hypothetical protein B2G71_20835 [Novosphingobium sp. PC22D]|uniref:glycosyltransferase n=1 Tax=Novosphingobium sp. PC22D TaxID=1962403 RepID=UPI000BF2274D|nr:glycosyltransferase [Novosphingobium sp. PC22D]PEQ10754.1 hypothetical protein B2G71_20835 [Novosphingobium sp. PC22D]
MTRKPVTLIAPVAPFRGGIARHSDAVAQALAQDPPVDLAVESFARLYPGWLYPGESDRDPARRDVVPGAAKVHRRLDTLNPLTWRRLAERVSARGGLAIIPAWTFFVAPALGTVARHLRARGLRVVTMVHNAADHDGGRWKAGVSHWQLAASDGFVVHSQHVADQLRTAGHRQPVLCLPHPAYDDYPAPTGALPREHALELLCFGLVRCYKGVDLALRALVRAEVRDVRLTIAGEIWEDGEAIRSLAGTMREGVRVELIDRYVSDQEAAELFARCDAVLAPYRAATGSGVAALARHYRRSLVASAVDGLSECVKEGEDGWLFPAGDEAALAALLSGPVHREAAQAMHAHMHAPNPGEGWKDFTAQIVVFAERL